MNKLQRLFELHRIFSQRRRPVSLRVIREQMDCSESTARRLVHALRDELSAPLAYDRTCNGWCYDDSPGSVTNCRACGSHRTSCTP